MASRKQRRGNRSCCRERHEGPRSRIRCPGGLSGLALILFGCVLSVHAWGQQYQIDPATLARIRSEATDHSQVGEFAFYLADVYGPRMTGSPNYRAAGEWAARTLRSCGLQDAHLEPIGDIHFSEDLKWSGRGWSYSRCSVRMVQPQEVQLLAVPAGWSVGTSGRVVADTFVAPFPGGPDEVEQYIKGFRGKLAGKIVLISKPAPVRRDIQHEFARYSDDELAKLALPGQGEVAGAAGSERRAAGSERRAAGSERGPAPVNSPGSAPQREPAGPGGSAPGTTPNPPSSSTLGRILEAWNRLLDFVHEEGVLALVQSAGGQGGTLFTTNQLGPPDPRNAPPPTVSLAAEHYNRLLRLKTKGIAVELEIELDSQFYKNADHFNVLAEIPGTSKKDEVVLIGAHLDSWFGGTGATDNAAGVAVVMEAMRILRKLELKMQRTLRLALWDAEELNAAGSRAFVAAQLVDARTGARKPLVEKLSVYFNIDNCAGKIRGIYLQGNKAAIPMFEAWFRPLRDLGATTVSLRNSEGSDHEVFDQAGVPAFQFIQDPLNYNTRTHHSTMDLIDYVPVNDLKQSAIVLAALAYEAATDPAMVPRGSTARPASSSQ